MPRHLGWELLAFVRFAGKKRADERTRTADLISLRVIIHALQGFARACRSRISKPVSSLACHALYRIAFPVVSEWCQKQVDGPSPSPLQVSLVRQSLRGGSARAIRHGDDGVEGLIASFLATTASSSARSFPFLCEPPLLECPLTFLHRTS